MWFVKRDDEKVSPPLPDENACFTWLLKHQGMSTDWALKHEGYSFTEEDEDQEGYQAAELILAIARDIIEGDNWTDPRELDKPAHLLASKYHQLYVKYDGKKISWDWPVNAGDQSRAAWLVEKIHKDDRQGNVVRWGVLLAELIHPGRPK